MFIFEIFCHVSIQLGVQILEIVVKMIYFQLDSLNIEIHCFPLRRTYGVPRTNVVYCYMLNSKHYLVQRIQFSLKLTLHVSTFEFF